MVPMVAPPGSCAGDCGVEQMPAFEALKASWRKPHSGHLPNSRERFLRKELPKLKLNGFARVVDTLAKSNDSVPAQRLAGVLLLSSPRDTI